MMQEIKIETGSVWTEEWRDFLMFLIENKFGINVQYLDIGIVIIAQKWNGTND